MTPRNRNWILIGLAVVLLACCCWALVFTGTIAFFSATTELSARPGPERTVIVITRLATATPSGATATREPSPLGTTAVPTRQATPVPTRVQATATPSAPPETRPVPPTSATATATAAPAPQASPTRGTGTAASEAEALLVEARMPQRNQRELALRLKPGVTEIPTVVNDTPPQYKVGDKARFWVSNSDEQRHWQITAELRYITPHVYVWVEDGVRLNQADLERSAKRFEEKTYPTNREFFGSEWTPGVDNDVHLNILHARGLGQNVAGYYSSADEFSRLVNPYSNEREMFYISADSDSARPNTEFYDGTLAHEFQHMIHWYNDANEDSWVNEGMSELASYLNGFDPGGFDYAYAQQPDTQLTTWADPSEGNAEHYGASYLFMAYFLDRFGEDLTKAVVASQENGILGFNEALAKAGRPERFNDIFADWLVANYLDAPKADREGRFGYTEIDPPPPVAVETHRRFPASTSAQVSQYGADYIRLRGRGSVQVDFQGQQSVGLVDAKPRGTYAWWSNRGDDSNSTLTRAFDLRGVQTATLTFWAWYDIEDGWDYAYVEVSTDGGQKWQILKGKYTTEENPVGNAFGPGWTGVSGNGKSPQWVQERVDLTPYAGKEILVRFEYVTDDAVNGPGLLVDDIAIPELNYSDGGESGKDGWQAAGWLLTDNSLEQSWLVQVLEIAGNTITVERMAVGTDGRGRLVIDDLGSADEVVLIISGLTPITTEPAKYNLTISPP